MEIVNHEFYVSPEIAKLLKEAGFDWKVNHYYFTQNGKTEVKSNFRYSEQNYNEPIATMDSKSFEFEVCSRPTLEVAQRWLREVKGCYVFAKPIFSANRKLLYYLSDIVYDKDYTLFAEFSAYEKAQEAGIKKALEIILEKGE